MYNVHISERMAEIMEEDKVTIKEEISTVEDTFTVFVVGEDVKQESTENQGINIRTVTKIDCIFRYY